MSAPEIYKHEGLIPLRDALWRYYINKSYLPWTHAGGDGKKQCAHGYAEGIFCSKCDSETIRVFLEAGRTRDLSQIVAAVKKP